MLVPIPCFQLVNIVIHVCLLTFWDCHFISCSLRPLGDSGFQLFYYDLSKSMKNSSPSSLFDEKGHMLSNSEFSIESLVVISQPIKFYNAEFMLIDEFLNIAPFFKRRITRLRDILQVTECVLGTNKCSNSLQENLVE